MKKTQTTHFTFSEIKNSTVEEIIHKFKNKSSYGWDGMPVKLLKSIKTVLIKPLTLIINQMLKTGTSQTSLKLPR